MCEPTKPELLLPAGNVETFFAAMSGGADAVYLGLQRFNARNRAANFGQRELVAAIAEAHHRHKKVYVTLNTLVKNDELDELIDTLAFLSFAHPDALIIQDLAIIPIVQRQFKNLKLHLSTQLCSHNELAAQYFENQQVERIILARETTRSELQQIVRKSPLPIEIFVHGALCYSFSGRCLFSSYLGGNSANRGLCTQVCRRNFVDTQGKRPMFSLKDLQLIDSVPFFAKIGVASLKIEGRMKNAEYVYKTAKAYRMVIDDSARLQEAKSLLLTDFAREKTQWFMGSDIKDVMSEHTGTGLYLGKIVGISDTGFSLSTDVRLRPGYRLRIRRASDEAGLAADITKVTNYNGMLYVTCQQAGFAIGDEVYLAATREYRHSDCHLKSLRLPMVPPLPKRDKTALRHALARRPVSKTVPQLYLRLSNFTDLKNIATDRFRAIFLNLSLRNLQKAATGIALSKALKSKVYIELPKYVNTNDIASLRKLLTELYDVGFHHFCVSDLSQMLLLPKGSVVAANENVYLMNDIATAYVVRQGIGTFCYPVETDYPNLLRGNDRDGLVTVYGHPELFYSRMPIQADNELCDEAGNVYRKSKQNGFTIIISVKPMSLTQYVGKLMGKGFYKFLIDFGHAPDLRRLNSVVEAVVNSKKIENTTDFNFKKGLH